VTARSGTAAARLGLAHGRISVRDTRSRWGSCAANGNLNFCWRLIFAPAFVLDYVVAHEVAHLRHPHHGPAFWRTVAALDDNVEQAKAWLRAHGEGLHFYG
ncbi:MAG: M48 family metallopeptidase, partial [Rhodospirillaceae bacterium]